MAVEAQLKLQIADFERKYRQATRTAKAESEEMRSVGSGAGSGLVAGMKGALGAATGLAAIMGTVRVGIDAVSIAVERNRAKLALSAVSAEDVNAQIERLRELAKDPALGFDQLVAGSTRLQAVGFDAEFAERTMREMGNALALVGGGKEELDGVLTALTQIVSKGTVSAEEINQIAERLPQIRSLMKEAFGTADTMALQKMNIGAQEFISSVVDAAADLERATDTSASALANLADEWTNLMQTVGDTIEPVIEPVANLMTRLLQGAGDFVKVMSAVPESIGTELFIMGSGMDAAQGQAFKDMMVLSKAREAKESREADPLESEATRAEKFARDAARAKSLEEQQKLAEDRADEAEARILKEREKRARERESALEELMTLRAEVEKQAFGLQSPEDQARAMRAQLGASLGIDINGIADIEKGLRASLEEAARARDAGDAKAEQAALEKLQREQELYQNLRSSTAFAEPANNRDLTGQGAFQNVVDQIFNRDPAAEQLRAMEEATREARESRITLDKILEQMGKPVPRDYFSEFGA